MHKRNKLFVSVNLINRIFFLLLVSSNAYGSEQEGHNHEALELSDESNSFYYTCSMHPEINLDGPGKCPICNMNLTKIEVEKEDEKIIDKQALDKVKKKLSPGDAIARVKLRKAHLSHFKPEFFKVTSMLMNKKIRLLGSAVQMEDRDRNISARISGRVEKVYVKSTGFLMKKGDPVVDLYSPALITTGEEYILARKSFEKSGNKDFKNLMNQSIARLTSWGIRKSQVQLWFRQGKVPEKITIYSGSTGIVRKLNAVVGRYFKEGQNFLELSDLSQLWVEMDVYEHDAALVSLGQEVELEFTALPGQVVKSIVDFIDPVLDESSRTLKIRVTIVNPDGRIKPGMVADATLSVHWPKESLIVPRSAVIDTGKRKVIWMKVSERQYQAKLVKTGFEAEGFIQIIAGLEENDQVVMEGNFLLDAQAQLFGGYETLPKANNDHSIH